MLQKAFLASVLGNMLTREAVTEQEEDIMEWIICSNL